MQNDRTTRRAVLAALGTTAASSLAGCIGMFSDDGSSEDPDEKPENESDGATDEEETPATREEIARALVDDVVAEEYESAAGRFVSTVDEGTLVAQLERTRMGLFAAGRSYEEIAATEATTVQGQNAVVATLAFAEARPDLQVRFTARDDVSAALITGEYETPDYVDAGAFEERAVELPVEDCVMDGTLTLPESDGEVPGVVLVPGSGPQDRDQTTGPNKPFRDLAEGLASRGVAALRYDKRTNACNPDPADATFDRIVVEDTLAAVDRIGDVDAVGDVAVVGHSLGGMAMPRILAESDAVVGGAALAAPARRLEDLYVAQYEYLTSVGEYTPPSRETALQQAETWAEQIRSGDYEADDQLFREYGAFWDSIDGYDQVAAAEGVDAPMLFLQGGRDYQVTPDDDFEQWQDALSGRSNVSFESYDQLNHAFMPGYGTSVPEEYVVPNNVAEAVVSDLAEWIGGL